MLKLVELLEELDQTSSSNKKKYILQGRPNCMEMIKFALNPFMMFNVTSKNLVDGDEHFGAIDWIDEAKPLLLQLFNRELTGTAAICMVNELLSNSSPESVDAFKRILDKDLKVGVGAKLVNKVWKKHIPQFDVQLCNKYLIEMNKVIVLPFKNTFVSRKLDGIRVVAIRQDGNWKFFSRTGKEFTTLGKLNKALLDSHQFDPIQADIVLDGECCIVDENGDEDFTAAVSQIKRKDFTIEHPKYYVFDMLLLSEFASGVSLYKFRDRFKKMKSVFGGETDYFEVLAQKHLETPKQLKDDIDMAVEKGWEGLILRNADTVYEGKRTKNLLKVKKMHEHEFKIVGFQEGEGQLEGTLGAIKVEGEYEGKKIKAKVGSGFTQKHLYFVKGRAIDDDQLQSFRQFNSELDDDAADDYIEIKSKPDPKGQRFKFWKNRKELIGQVVTIQFFEISKNKQGKYSLRFPVFKALHGEVRDL